MQASDAKTDPTLAARLREAAEPNMHDFGLIMVEAADALDAAARREEQYRAACEAAMRYDASICGRAARGEYSMAQGVSYAEGDDLDALYEDWTEKAKAALAARGEGVGDGK